MNHYDETPFVGTSSTLRKGATLEREYALQTDKAGDPSKAFWMCMCQHSLRPLRDASGILVVWGRGFDLGPPESGRHVIVDARTIANELATETPLKFEAQPKQ